ncbi:MAG: hypothetical protein WAW37_14145 [Syntrophobacteraceae bacterium]
MAENRRRINLLNSGQRSSDREFERAVKAMEDQLRVQNEIVSAERERQLALEKTRERQELIGREAQKSLQTLRSEAADSGFSASIDRNTREMAEAGAAFDEMRSSGEKFISSTGSGLKNLFGSILKGELTSAKDLWGAFCNFLADSLSKVLSKMAASGFEQMLGGLFGSISGGGGSSPFGFLSGIFHSGGVAGEAEAYRMLSPLAFAGAPRLHSGLAPDEFPAILQRGEAVIPKGKWSTGGGPQALKVEVRIDNQSSAPLKLEQGPVARNIDKLVIGIVAKDIDEYGVLGKMIKNQRRS